MVFSPLNQLSYIETIFFADRLAQNNCGWSLGGFLCRDQEINGQLLNFPVPRMALAEFVVLRIWFRDLLLGRVLMLAGTFNEQIPTAKHSKRCPTWNATWRLHSDNHSGVLMHTCYSYIFIDSHALYLKCVIYFYRSDPAGIVLV